MPERLRAALDAGWRGEMPRTVWIVRDGAREARSGLLTADVLDGGLQRAGLMRKRARRRVERSVRPLA